MESAFILWDMEKVYFDNNTPSQLVEILNLVRRQKYWKLCWALSYYAIIRQCEF
jgi:hypothetical protein